MSSRARRGSVEGAEFIGILIPQHSTYSCLPATNSLTAMVPGRVERRENHFSRLQIRLFSSWGCFIFTQQHAQLERWDWTNQPGSVLQLLEKLLNNRNILFFSVLEHVMIWTFPFTVQDFNASWRWFHWRMICVWSIILIP